MDPISQRLLIGSGGANESLFVENVFSTWLYTGTNATLPISNGIDLAGEGGLTWVACRSRPYGNRLIDTARGVTKTISTETANAEATETGGVTAFNSDGFTLGSSDTDYNQSGEAYASWTFRKAPKFFDIVTYTGTGVARTVSHSLGSIPGCIIVKRTDNTGEWPVYHRANTANPETDYLVLNNGSVGTADSDTRWNDTQPTSAVFSLGTDATVNANGGTYVAYLFAHEAGGFGVSGNDNIISCGSYTGNGSTTGPVIDLGWEPQWLLIKRTGGTGDWNIIDSTRGLVVGGNDAQLNANTASEENLATVVTPLATGFQLNTTANAYNGNTGTYIYIAIRRGPMKTPTDATQVFAPSLYTGTNVDNRLVTTGIVTDMVWVRQRNDGVLAGMVVGDRLRGQPYMLTGYSTEDLADADAFDQQLAAAAERGTAFSSNIGFWVGNDATAKLNVNTTSDNHVALAFRRAPGFFDMVAYTGTGVARTVEHNLGVVPELMIVKRRSPLPGSWAVYANNDNTNYLKFDSHDASSDDNTIWNDTSPTSSVFTVGTGAPVNVNASMYIAYLFASCPGVSKVGTYTGNGTSQTIDCGFTNGARFVLIKRTDSLGDWLVADTARGIVSGNDSLLRLNTVSAEATGDWIDPDSSGFIINQEVNANVNNASYIYLAIA